MITHLDPVTLKSGEVVQAAILSAPEPDWAERMLDMLSHKGDPWNWQNAAVLERALDLDAFFYVLHRSDSNGDGLPFANIMTIEQGGVGLFGHVWTKPEERQKGASTTLMDIQMGDFQNRGGRALYLTTGYPVAHRLYENYGFRELEDGSGLMAYTKDSLSGFEEGYFGSNQPLLAKIQPLGWRHWPAACPLFFGGSSGIVRAASLGMIGRSTPEGAFLPLLQRAEKEPDQPPQAMILELENGAVAGMAVWGMHPIWPNTCIVDLYCHENYWAHGGELLDALTLPQTARCIAYSDGACPVKNEVLMKAGYVQEATVPKWLSASAADDANVDLLMHVKR